MTWIAADWRQPSVADRLVPLDDENDCHFRYRAALPEADVYVINVAGAGYPKMTRSRAELAEARYHLTVGERRVPSDAAPDPEAGKPPSGPAEYPATTVMPDSRFSTPSENIACSANERAMRCDIKERGWSPPPKPPSCEFDWGPAVVVGGPEPARFICVSDSVADPAAPILDYGESRRLGDIECISRRDGLTCSDRTTGRGFTLSRGRYDLF